MGKATFEDLVRELHDRGAICDLISRLGRWLDEKRFDDREMIASLFTAGVEVETPGGTSHGEAAAVEQARKHHTEERIQHLFTNVLVELAGDSATAHANMIVTRVPRADVPHAISQAGTRYRFTFARTSTGWRFSSIKDELIWRRPFGDH
jgi:SnoaL-like domain